MGIMDSLGTEHSNLVQQVMTWHTALQSRRTSPPSITALEDMGYASQHVDAAYSADTPPAGIVGVGVGDLRDKLRPVVFVLMELMTAPVEMPSDQGIAITPAQKLVASYIDSFPSDLVLIGLPRVKISATYVVDLPLRSIPWKALWALPLRLRTADPDTSQQGMARVISAARYWLETCTSALSCSQVLVNAHL
jgi:hypothetical protein